jgi:predicted AlkP superfamily phosphohydrolase/phosphomutase
MTAHKPRILVIGLDGATLDLIEPWAHAGHLPVMKSLMDSGSYGRLLSVMPVLSSAAWSSFMTGMNPGKTSIYDFVRREAGSYRLRTVRRDHNQAPSLWKRLSQHGYQVGVVNVPMTYPPEAVNGILVTGLGTPDFKPFTYPPELGAELTARGYRVNKRVSYRPGNEDAYLREVYELAGRHCETALWLMGSRPWDFFMMVFFDTDQINHYFWKHMDRSHPARNPKTDDPYADTILRFYQLMDANIGRLVAAAGPETTVFVISDHGAGPYYKDVFPNEWLRQAGYLSTDGETATLKGSHRLFGRLGITRSNISIVLRKAHLGRVERWIKDAIGDRIELLPRTQRAEFPQAIDWAHTRAYSFGYQGQIYINLQGREPQGIVAPGAEYEQLLHELTERLTSWTDPEDGRGVVDRVYRREELFSGPYVGYAPDLTLVMRGLAYNTKPGYEFSTEPGKVIDRPITFETGSHRPEGMLIMAGPGVIPSQDARIGARLIDVTPTVLHLMGCPLPAEMDGQVLESWLTGDVSPTRLPPEPPSAGPEPSTSDWSEEEEQEMIRRLKNLGYLE